MDRFASYYNNKTPRFNSRCWNPGCEAIDTFTVDCFFGKQLGASTYLIDTQSFEACKTQKLVKHRYVHVGMWCLFGPCSIQMVIIQQEQWWKFMNFPRNGEYLFQVRGGNKEFIDNIVRSRILAVRLDFKR